MNLYLAMIVYRSWQERLFSRETVTDLLILAIWVSLVLLLVLTYRRFPFRGPYLSGPFVLALCPFLFTAILALLLNYEDPTSNYVLNRLRPVFSMVSFGFIASVVSIGIYSVLYVMSRKGSSRPPPKAPVPRPPQNEPDC
jgi:hypothetical protein